MECAVSWLVTKVRRLGNSATRARPPLNPVVVLRLLSEGSVGKVNELGQLVHVVQLNSKECINYNGHEREKQGVGGYATKGQRDKLRRACVLFFLLVYV